MSHRAGPIPRLGPLTPLWNQLLAVKWGKTLVRMFIVWGPYLERGGDPRGSTACRICGALCKSNLRGLSLKSRRILGRR